MSAMTRVVSPVFVGRRAELDRLATMVNDAGEGRPSLVMLAGEAGIGKSRLVDEFAWRTRLVGTRVAVGACLNSANIDQQYAPLRAALRDLTTQPGPDAEDLPSELEWLADGNERTTGPTLGQRFESLVQFLARLAALAPLVLVFEDLHWAETSTLDLVTFLAQQIRQLRLAVLGTYRHDDLHRGHPLRPVLAELKRARVEFVKLGGLSHAEIRLLLESLSPTMPTDTVVNTMLARTQGNPFYVEELIAAEREGEIGLPQSLRDTLLSRVDALPPLCQELLRVMAIVSSPIRHDMLVHLEPPDVDLDATLAPALEAGTIVAVPPNCYRFRHALTEEALAAELLLGHRVRLHRQIAEALETEPQLAGGGRAAAVGETLPEASAAFADVELSDGRSSVPLLEAAAKLALATGDLAAADEAVATAIALAHRDCSIDDIWITVIAAQVRLAAGRIDDARAAIDDARQRLAERGAVNARIEAAAVGVMIEGEATRWGTRRHGADANQRVSLLLDEAREGVERMRRNGGDISPAAAAWLALASAEASLATGHSDGDAWGDAVVALDDASLIFLAARARLRRAEAIIVGRGSRVEAGRLVAEARAVADTGGARALLDEADQLIVQARLGTAAQAPASTRTGAAAEYGLTPRETEVLGHLVRGSTNRQIASELFISAKTASVHVSNLLRKLGVSNRVDAGAVGQHLGLS